MTNLDTDVQALVDAAVSKALANQAGYTSPEAAAANEAEVVALRTQPHPMENQALTSNPIDPDDTTIHGTAIKVSVGDSSTAPVGVEAVPVPASAPTTGGTAPYAPVGDTVTGGNV